jgi:hypothetical protein
MLFNTLEEHKIDYHPIGSLNPVLRVRNVIRELGQPLLKLKIEDFMSELTEPIEDNNYNITLREKHVIKPSINIDTI